MATQGEQDFKWLKTMDSEAIISTVAQLKGTRDTEKSVPVALTTKKRTPRKRTKSVKAAEADEVAELLDADSAPPAKKACAEVGAAAPAPAAPAPPQPLPAAAPCAVLDHSQAAGAVPLFKPVSELPAASTVEQSTAPSQIPAAEDVGAQLPTEELPAADVNVRAPEPPGPAVPTWPAQHIAPVEQVAHEGVAEPEPVQSMELEAVKYEAVEHGVNQENTMENSAALAVPVPQVPVAGLSQHPPAVPAAVSNTAVPTAEMIYSQHIQQAAAANAANVLTTGPPSLPTMSADGTDAAQLEAMHAANEAQETQTKYTGVRKNKGGRFSARIKLGGVNRYLGSFTTAEEAARAFDAVAIQNGRPVETLNFPAAYGGPTVGQAYRKRKVHKLYEDPGHQINILLQKLADVDRSNPGILRLTMGTLGVPENRYMSDNKYSGVRQQSSHWETRIRYKDKLYSMGFYASVEAAALAWDITAASLQRCRKLNFPEVSFSDLEQQLDALKCVISQAVPASQTIAMPAPLPQPMPAQMLPDPNDVVMDPGHAEQHTDGGMHPPADMRQQEATHATDGLHPHVPGPSDAENHAGGVPAPAMNQPEEGHNIPPAEGVPQPDGGPQGSVQMVPPQPLTSVPVPGTSNDPALVQVAMVSDQAVPQAADMPVGMCVPDAQQVHAEMPFTAEATPVMHHAADEAVASGTGPEDLSTQPEDHTHPVSDVAHHDNGQGGEPAAADGAAGAEGTLASSAPHDVNSTVPEGALPVLEHMHPPTFIKMEAEAGENSAAVAAAIVGIDGSVPVDQNGACVGPPQMPAQSSIAAAGFAAAPEMHTEFPASENVVPVTTSAIATAALASVREIVWADAQKAEAAQMQLQAAAVDTQAQQAPESLSFQPEQTEVPAEGQN